MFKKVCIFVLTIIIMSTNCFSAIVSDNDGAAFITKAEFDALKKSFNEQIVSYNDSIDRKIDGAIASYLAGIRITDIKTTDALYAPSSGVMSISRDTSGNSTCLLWQEGDMKFTVSTGVGRMCQSGTTATGEAWLNWASSANNKFWETLVSDVDYTNGIAAFFGYKATKQNIAINSFGSRYGDWPFSSDYQTKCYLYIGEGFGALSNQTLSDYGGTDPYMWFACMYGTKTTANPGDINYCYMNGNQSSFKREINDSDQESDKTFDGGLILNADGCTYKRFSNYDEIRDWCNDSDLTGHTKITDMSHFGGTMSSTVYYRTTSEHYFTQYTPSTTGFGEFTSKTDATGKYQWRYPYFGFIKNATDWKNIYVPSMDDIYNDALISTDANKTKNTLVYKSKNHVKLGAGLPLANFAKNNEVTYEFDFKDKTKNYNVWVKEGSFDSSKSLSAEYANCISNFKIYDSTTTYNSTYHCLSIKNGSGKVKFVTTKECVPYLKWSDVAISSANDINRGGGILYPMSSINYVLVDE